MTKRTKVLAALAAVTVSAGCGPGESASFEIPDWSGSWYRGNTHAHTTQSDGDSSPEYVTRWYRDHGYDFLVLSDHNVFTDPSTLASLVDSSFLLIPGEELTSSFEDASVHVNGLNLPGLVEARHAESLVGTIQANVDAVRDVDGVPHINHPNFGWSFGAEELLQVERDRLLEIWNGHPTVHNDGGGGSTSLEEIWDVLLTAGKRIYGIAVDDAHHFQGEFEPDRANPGRGWIAVRAPSLDPLTLMSALEVGHFYASTGVELDDVVVTAQGIVVHIAADRDFRYTTTFIGTGGEVLAETDENPAVFELVDDVGYVRARIRNSRGDVAWTQPVFVVDDSNPTPSTPPGGAAAESFVEVEYVAHASFVLRTSDGTELLIDPYASRVWLGYDWPGGIDPDGILITHPHYDHDAGRYRGMPFPWGPSVAVVDAPGTYEFGDFVVTGVEGKHADPYGMEFGQINTLMLIEAHGLRIAHLGDNGPLTADMIGGLGRVDVLMIPADGDDHILSADATAAIIRALDPSIVIPMHYRLPDLELDETSPSDLGQVDVWLEGRSGVVRLGRNVERLRRDALPRSRQYLVFDHAPYVTAPEPGR